ncbi:MAG: endopeptidase La [Acetobacter sp.]|nr:endopeptidase La [Bacteroides sp.]MCM1341402.1 endopeptidase La [Acetobacter sp.]MCM1433356.1 endopeptidase La [Clostridiales bacterium]
MNEFEILNDITELPVIPLRGLVVFPKMVLHFDVGRKKSIEAIRSAMQSNQKIFLVCQKNASVDDPAVDNLYEIGVVCNIKQMIRIPNSENLRVVVDGVDRGMLIALTQNKPFLSASVDVLEDDEDNNGKNDIAYQRIARNEFENYVSLIPKISSDVFAKVLSIKDSGELADYICSNTFIDYSDKQEILSTLNHSERLSKLLVLLKKEVASLEIEIDIQEKVQAEIDKNQKEYYLREEMKVIAESLGETESPIEEADEYRKKIKALSCGEEVSEKLLSCCNKLVKMPSGSHEATVIRNYLDKCLEIPFGKFTKDTINLDKARKILDKEHYGLDKIKERIVDSLAVYKRNPDFSGQILCLAGPPGVGKTSIVKSLAKSMNRKYVRVALGGIHDEAEIRGHRKTYIGSMPGRIAEAVIKSGVMNPIILLDEIDKLGNDYKGDPSSALLEALDPEQNNTFTDHYIEFPLDLSKVLFITTANDVSAISAPLYDRMEVIELSSYTVEEKFNIAKKHLIKKELELHNISRQEFKINDNAIYSLIECYTKEAGVRNLQKQIASLCRKASVALEEGQTLFKVTDKNIESIIGKRKYKQERIDGESQIGTVNGLAWTSVGGTMLPIEVSALDGTGKIELTGNLGDVMKESAKTAVSFVRSRCCTFGIDSDFYKKKDIHIHTPEAAISKDGPSAGLAFTTALVSELTGVPIKSNVAMTGEITLKGKALAIGGLKEKSMAAYKAGCNIVIIPKDNEIDLTEISEEVKTSVEFISVSSFDEILDIAFDGKIIKNTHVAGSYLTTDKQHNAVAAQ